MKRERYEITRTKDIEGVINRLIIDYGDVFKDL